MSEYFSQWEFINSKSSIGAIYSKFDDSKLSKSPTPHFCLIFVDCATNDFGRRAFSVAVVSQLTAVHSVVPRGECLCIVLISIWQQYICVKIFRYISSRFKMYFFKLEIIFLQNWAPTHCSALRCPRGECLCIVLISSSQPNISVQIFKHICSNWQM